MEKKSKEDKKVINSLVAAMFLYMHKCSFCFMVFLGQYLFNKTLAPRFCTKIHSYNTSMKRTITK